MTSKPPTDEQPKPVPRPNPETQAFWDNCRDGILSVQRCESCGAMQHYPRLLCIACGSQALKQTPVSGKGTVTSFTINRVPVSEAFAADVPYAVALITLAEGPTMMANVTGCDLDTLTIGMAVEVLFEARGEQMLPQFRPV